MKLLYLSLLVSCLCFCSYAQEAIVDTSYINDFSFKVIIRKSFQESNPNIKFSPRTLKSSEVFYIQSIQDESEIVVYVLDERHEVIIYPSNINDIEEGL